MRTKKKHSIFTDPAVKAVDDDHGLGGNARAVFLHYAEVWGENSWAGYGLEAAIAGVEGEMLNDRQKADVISALRDLYQRWYLRPLSFDRVTT